jgi:hypothetical protein
MDSKPVKINKRHGRLSVSKTERWLGPDRIDKVTFRAFARRWTLYKAAERCPRCDAKLADGRCVNALGRRKWCDG